MKSVNYKYFLLVTFTINLALGCSQESSNDKNFTFTWETALPEDVGINKEVIDSINLEIQNGEYGLIDHFLLIRHGKIVADYHYDQDYKTISKNFDTTRHQYNYDHPDWHPYYNNSELHSLQSVSKSITSLLLGIAMDEGLTPHLDTAILPLFSDYQIDTSDDLKKSITLRNLLTMQSGISWNSRDNLDPMELSDDWIQYVLSLPMDTVPGSRFVYNDGVSVLIGKIVRLTTGKRIDKWAEEKLFGPLGITEYYWKQTPLGEIDTEGGLYLKPRDLAKIGYLMINEGLWEGERIVSKKWIDESIQPAVTVDDKRSYGYQWWIQQDKGVIKTFGGAGYGGQFVTVYPKYDIVIVFNAWNIHRRARDKKKANRILDERIVPNIQL